ncbi:MerR family transcriptional regulator [Streptomyces lichenis]|uniref:MerR family transcriptional regulator n=1 Tax=Streptomyces lichenis TaxID=2306967 RepID=A0ABT0IGT7_9ACTN|nr:MerR family transcriptional regulator [Streptomyces lichenis]MCK8680533.1 MerR family transcriptional regulator [Streptomyces lichenis]
MRLLTIGAFARASRLSPKALRLYDELGLLTPARVDPLTGYRHYAPEQLEHARLVAWLRRLGMPLARIQRIGTLDADAAAQEIRAFWARVEAETAERRHLAAFLVDHLSRRGSDMPAITTPPLEIRYAALSHQGLVRSSNQDTAYAGSRLLAVADGFGGAGAPAGSAAIEALKRLEGDAWEGDEGGLPVGSLLGALQDAVEQAGRAVRSITAEGGDGDGPGEEAGTTLTALLWTGSRLALAHVGDSRAYLLRDGELFQITHDHTLVQSMVDEGRLSPDEAGSHPQRSLLTRALGLHAQAGNGAAGTAPADVRLHDARAGDRWLLCSDGLSAVVPAEELRRVVASADGPEQAVHRLVELANRYGGPDNVSCAVADLREPAAATASPLPTPPPPPTAPTTPGA